MLAKQQIFALIKDFNFATLFNELGWDHDKNPPLPLSFNDQAYQLIRIAQKRGFTIFHCITENLPHRNDRRKIFSETRKRHHENLIIFCDTHKQTQIWHVEIASNKTIEIEYKQDQEPELLWQKLNPLAFKLEEENQITLFDVTNRIQENFKPNHEKVTKSFYDEFKKQHTAFKAQIIGIKEQDDLEWYTSVMLNRLMFVYFIQKKGFLDGNIHYLRDKLAAYQNFHTTFYRDFLLVFFHQGLGQRDRSTELVTKLGNIPYLNGGFFDVHEIESRHGEIDIPDEAFEKLFAFFDEWNWHLDDRQSSTGRDINPDVVGYIFEKYINQKQMGAYYTKEDITEYISKNVIIPFLFDKAGIDETNPCWQLLQKDPECYIYPSVLKGVNETLPEEIACGLDSECDYATLKERRKHWNKAAAPHVALPTETWREHIARRNRCIDVRQKLQNGEVKNINALITYNLNIRQFAEDAVQTFDEVLLKRFLEALQNVKILDPTCGSGAFLFAALNILEPLYKICTERIAERLPAESLPAEPLQSRNRKIAQEKDEQSRNRKIAQNKYSIYKQIILNNLYGVDIMEEAVEICKLRLFLKLAAEIDDASQIEPLPDIDFNIRCGNTLVGYTTMEQILNSMGGMRSDKISQLETKAQKLSETYKRFIENQSANEFKEKVKPAIKADYRRQLDELNDELSAYLASTEYGIKTESGKAEWRRSHRPFHWLIEFYGIMHNGGFDCIIGNPPYVEYSKVKQEYTIKGYKTEKCGNLYAMVMERSVDIMQQNGCIGMILPIASSATERMEKLQVLYSDKNGYQWFSHFAIRPGKLFPGADIDLTITIIRCGHSKTRRYSTTYNRWNDGKESVSNRKYLFEFLTYTDISEANTFVGKFPKISNSIEMSIYEKMYQSKKILGDFISGKTPTIFYHSGGRYWKKALHEKLSSHYKGITVLKEHKEIITCILNSQLFYWYWIGNSNCMDVVSREVEKYPVFDIGKNNDTLFGELASVLLKDYYKNAKTRTREGEKIQGEELNFDVSLSKPILDRIDEVLGVHYGFTSEELDFIINYDIKYRLGGAAE